MKNKGRIAAVLAVVLLAAILLFLPTIGGADLTQFQAKVEQLRQEALADWVREELGDAPAGGAGQAVFLSVSNGTERASVYTGTGQTLDDAWANAAEQAEKALRKSGATPRWVKADLVYFSGVVTADSLAQAMRDTREGFFRYGAAFDGGFQTALLEAELNSAGIYDYENGGVDLEALNQYLKTAGRERLDALPSEYTLFQCASWLCDEVGTVRQLSAAGLDYGRRSIDPITGEFAQALVLDAAGFLEEQVQKDGTFLYGMDPRFDKPLKSYNILRHAGSLWSMICAYRLNPSDSLREKIDLAAEYLVSQVRYDDEGRAFVYEEKSDEIKLGGCGLGIIALTEYMDVFQDSRYLYVSKALGDGILSLMDRTAGTYYHVLNGDFSRKEEERTVYYDGEATFALCRLYGVTEDRTYLEAAQAAVNHFILADYTQYCDHWVSYAMNEITKYIPDSATYYAFGLENVQKNLAKIARQETTSHIYLELLMAGFELYDRMIANGGSSAGFDLPAFLEAIRTRTDRQLNGYFFPEYAMYMANPERILGTFMVRQDGFRVRIDDVQHNLGGYYLYQKNYEKLMALGLYDAAG